MCDSLWIGFKRVKALLAALSILLSSTNCTHRFASGFFFFGINTILVPIFRGCFQFDPSVLISFDWVPVFLSRFQVYP